LVAVAVVVAAIATGAVTPVVGAPGDVRIERAVEAAGTIEVLFNESEGSFTDPPEATDLEIRLDGRVVVNNGSDATGPSRGEWGIRNFSQGGTNATFTLTHNGSVADITPNRNLTVEFEGVSTSTVSGDPEERVTVTGTVVRERGTHDRPADAIRVYNGTPLAIVFDGVDRSVFLNTTGQDLATGTDSAVLTLSSSSFPIGEVTAVDFGANASQVQYFVVRELGWNVTVGTTTIDEQTDLTVDVRATRAGAPFTATLVDGAGSRVETVVRDLGGDGTSTINFGPQTPGAGPYRVMVTDNRSGVTAETAPVTVESTISGTVDLDRTTYREDRGDVVEIGVSLSETNARNATVTLGDAAANGWSQNVTVRDGDGDEVVTLAVNTYTVGTTDDTTASGASYPVYSTVDADDAVSHVSPADGPFDPSTPAAATLPTGTYPVAASPGVRPPAEVVGGPSDTAALVVGNRSTSGLSTYVAPASQRAELTEVSDLLALFSNDSHRDGAMVATNDTVVVQVDASGLEGVLRNRTASETGGSDVTAAWFASAVGGETTGGVWEFGLERTNGSTDTPLGVDATNTVLIPQPEADDYWLVVDTSRLSGIAPGDNVTARFGLPSGADALGDGRRVRDEWSAVAATANVSTGTDLDGDGRTDEVLVDPEPNQTLAGTTTVAAGTPLTVLVTATDENASFSKRLSTVVEPDRTWQVTGDFDDAPSRTNITITVARPSGPLTEPPVAGRINFEPFAGGDGSVDDPYRIANWRHLDNAREDPGAEYRLVANLTPASPGYGTIVGGQAGFAPIGNATDPFTGQFDGENHRVTGLRINRSGADRVGLFAVVAGSGTVDRTTLANASVSGGAVVGTIAGRNRGTVVRSDATGSIAGTDDVGGLVGRNHGTVARAATDGRVAGDDATSGTDVGGVVGENTGTVTRSYSTATVSGSRRVAGLVGANAGRVARSYARGAVSGESRVGGLVGVNENGSVVRGYAAGTVSGSYLVGGLVAADGGAGRVSESYWDLNATEQSTSTGGTRLRTAQMVGRAARANMSGFDFLGTWIVRPSDYPALTWQRVDDPPVVRADAYVTRVNESVTVDAPGVLANDTDPNGKGLTATVADRPGDGQLRLAANGSFTYRPDPGFAGTDTFVYTVTDDTGNTASATVTLTVSASGGNATLGSTFPDGLPGGSVDRPPTDVDGDGVADDMNGDGVFQFVDVVEFVFALQSADYGSLSSGQVALLDHDEDGDVDFVDVVDLVFQLQGR
jgi:hypothetical protein